MSTTPLYRYKAFLSYSRRDTAIATSLRNGLHAFNRPWYALWSNRVFQDTADATVQSNLDSLIKTALDQSEYLVVVGSKASAESVWVGREIAYWLEKKRPIDNLLLVIADGDIAWDDRAGDFDWNVTKCLRVELQGQFKSVPTYLDLRSFEGKAVNLQNAVFLDAVATLTSSLTGKEKATLTGEDRRKQKTRMALATGAIAGLVILSLTAGWFAISQRMAAAEALAEQRVAEAATIRAGVALRRTLKAQAETAEALRATEAARDEANERRLEAEAQTRRAVGERLAAQSASYMRRRFDVGVLLAIEAARRTSLDGPTRIAAVEQAVIDSLSAAGGTPLGTIGARHEQGLAFATQSPTLAVLRADGVELFDLSTVDPSNATTRLRVPNGKLLAVAISADGRTVAAGTAAERGQIANPIIWQRTNDGWTSRTLRGWNREVPDIALSANGRHAVAADDDGNIGLYDLNSSDSSPQKFSAHKGSAEITSVGGTRFITTSRDDLVQHWDFDADTPSPVELRTPRVGHGNLRGVAFSPNGRWAAVSSDEGTVALWRTDTSPPEKVEEADIQGDVLAINDAASDVIVSRNDGRVHIWSLGRTSSLLCAGEPKLPYMYAAIDPVGQWLAVSGLDLDDVRACAWDLTADDPAGTETTLRADDGGQLIPYFSPDGRWLLTVSDNKARLWRTERGFVGLAYHQLATYTDTGVATVATPDGRHLIVVKGRKAHVYDVDASNVVPVTNRSIAGRLLAVNNDLDTWITRENEQIVLRRTGSEDGLRVLGEGDVHTLVALSPTGRYVAMLNEQEATLFDLRRESSTSFRVPDTIHSAIVFSHDEHWVLVNSFLTRLGDSPVRYELQHPPSPTPTGSEDLRTAAFSPDGRYLATGFGNTAWRWDLRVPAATPVALVRTRDDLRVVEYSPNGRLLVAGSYDKSAHLVRFDPHGNVAAPIPLRVSEHFVAMAAFSRDSRWLAVGSVDKHAYLWDTASDLRSIVPVKFDGDGVFVSCVLFGGPKGERLFVAFNRGGSAISVRAFERSLSVLERLAAKTVSRNLTVDEWQQFFPGEDYRKTFDRLP